MSEPIRHARAEDLPALGAIYAHYVLTSAITFDEKPKTDQELGRWLAGFSPEGPHQLLVFADPDPLGYVSSHAFRTKDAYRTTVEMSIYLHHEATGRGVGGALVDALFGRLSEHEVHRVVAGTTLPNPASVALLEGRGFERVGVFTEVGFKRGRYWDVAWYQRGA